MIKEVSVIGAGIMGRSIALVYATKNFKVNLFDVSPSVLYDSKKVIEKDLLSLANEGIIAHVKVQEALDNINLVHDLKIAVANSDFITEAIPEKLELKFELFKQLEDYAKGEAIIASNTSTFPASVLAKDMVKPERFIITHFFNPAHLVPLVEIVKTEETSPEVVSQTQSLMSMLGKKAIVLKKEVPGFIANRLQAAILREALYLLDNDIADARDIDLAITAGPGFRWAFIGPIATADFNGLDTWQQIMNNLYPDLDCSKSSPPMINDLVEKGKLGAKTGEGMYQYNDESGETVSSQITTRNLNLTKLLKLLSN